MFVGLTRTPFRKSDNAPHAILKASRSKAFDVTTLVCVTLQGYCTCEFVSCKVPISVMQAAAGQVQLSTGFYIT